MLSAFNKSYIDCTDISEFESGSDLVVLCKIKYPGEQTANALASNVNDGGQKEPSRKFLKQCIESATFWYGQARQSTKGYWTTLGAELTSGGKKGLELEFCLFDFDPDVDLDQAKKDLLELIDENFPN